MNIICHSFCRDLRGFIVAVFDRFCFAPSLTRNELRPSAFTSEMTRFFNGWPSMQAWKSRIGPDSRYGLRFWDDEYFNLTGVHHLVGVFYFPIPFFLVISTDNHPVGVEKWYLPPGILVCGVFYLNVEAIHKDSCKQLASDDPSGSLGNKPLKCHQEQKPNQFAVQVGSLARSKF